MKARLVSRRKRGATGLFATMGGLIGICRTVTPVLATYAVIMSVDAAERKFAALCHQLSNKQLKTSWNVQILSCCSDLACVLVW